MDYLQTKKHYRREKSRRTFFFFLRLLVLAAGIWLGWSLGYSRNSAITERSNSDVITLRQENERLAQRITTLNNEIETIRRESEEAALQQGIGNGDGKSAADRLTRQIAHHLANGIEEERIAHALNSLVDPSRCRALGAQDVAVATDLFAGPESVASMLDGAVKIFLAGEAGRDATRDKPWYDPRRPVSMRIAYLGGEQISEGRLPIKANIIADGWILRINASAADLQGYANVAMEKCGTR